MTAVLRAEDASRVPHNEIAATTGEPRRSIEEAKSLELMEEKQPIRCGVNALYMLIRLHGGNPDLSLISEQLEQRIEGHSLLDLRNCAARLGYETVVEKLVGDQLLDVPLPVIAHLHAAMLNNHNVGHFVVVLAADSEMVTYLDGTTGNEVTGKRIWFNKITTGHILRLRQSNDLASNVQMATFIAILGLSACLIRYIV